MLMSTISSFNILPNKLTVFKKDIMKFFRATFLQNTLG